jgi:hypothetical protein
MPRYRLNLNLPTDLWHILRDLAERWNCSTDQAIFRLIDRAGGELPSSGPTLAQDRCENYDPYYGECRMADGSKPTCHT